MRITTLIPAFIATTLLGCGVETASTAATAAALKKQEAEQGKQTMEMAERKIKSATDAMHRSAQESARAAEGE